MVLWTRRSGDHLFWFCFYFRLVSDLIEHFICFIGISEQAKYFNISLSRFMGIPFRQKWMLNVGLEVDQ